MKISKDQNKRNVTIKYVFVEDDNVFRCCNLCDAKNIFCDHNSLCRGNGRPGDREDNKTGYWKEVKE